MFDMILNMPFVRQFLLFKPLSYCFKETIEFDVKASSAMRPESRLIKLGDIAKEFSEKAIQVRGTFHDSKITS